MQHNLFSQFDNGTLMAGENTYALAQQPWQPHNEYFGVFLKTLVSAEHTGGLCTCHMVRIKPDHAILLHTHPGSLELHEVLQGSGVCYINTMATPYTPGTVGVIPANTPHEVKADKHGLVLFAKFIATRVF